MNIRYILLSSVSALAIVTATANAKKPEHNNDRPTDPVTDTTNQPDQTGCLAQEEDIFRNPFNAESAHHRPIGQNAQFADDNDPMTEQLKKAGFNTINSPGTNGYGFGIYEAKDGDATITVTNNGTKSGKGLPATVKAPKELTAPSGGEGVVVIYDSTTGKAHEFLNWQNNGNNATASIHHEWDPKDKGHTQPGGERVGLSASGVAGMFGILRGFEANKSGCAIQHAIQITLTLKGQCGSMVSDEIVGPASSTDSSCKEGACKGTIPYGALLAIPPKSSVPIDSLGLSEPGMRLAESLQKYGGYVVDTSGGCPSIRSDQELTKETQQQLMTDMHKLFPLLRAVTNNDITQPTSGGGAPCAENAAFDAQQVDETVVSCSGDNNTDTENDQRNNIEDNQNTDIEKDTSSWPDPDNEESSVPPQDPRPVPPPEIVDPPHDPVPPPEVIQPGEDGTTDWRKNTSEWLWEHIPHTAEGLKLFQEWIAEFWK